eukprot:6957883-Pyramimonas_sp.AAC.1
MCIRDRRSNARVPPDVFTHIAVGYGGGRSKIYLNGTLRGSQREGAQVRAPNLPKPNPPKPHLTGDVPGYTRHPRSYWTRAGDGRVQSVKGKPLEYIIKRFPMIVDPPKP